jgi:hypothetical protein
MTDIITTTPTLPAGHHAVPGGWVVLRDPSTVTERQRRPLTTLAASLSSYQSMLDPDNPESQTQIASNPEAIAMFQQFNDLLALALLESWSFAGPDGQPLPIAENSLLDLPGAAYDAIQKVVAPMLMSVMPNFDPSPDPASPTVPSNA